MVRDVPLEIKIMAVDFYRTNTAAIKAQTSIHQSTRRPFCLLCPGKKTSIMKKSILIILIASLPFLAFSQSIFDKYDDMDHVASITINKGLIDLMGNINIEGDQEAQDFIDVARGINGIKVLITEDKSVSADMDVTVRKYLKSSSLEELMRIKDKDTNVKFYIRNGKDDNHVSELLMFVSGLDQTDLDINGRKLETVLVSMTGNIDLTKIGALTNKMNLPKELNKAGH